ncbi:hypothetical protein B0H13DRAFT_2315143 [Mycena leptocephala]|nr:hypothetical protein B0H13DRAFT_2315143 [Mycena leptocephala]
MSTIPFWVDASTSWGVVDPVCPWNYGVASFLPLAPSAFKPLDTLNKSVSRCITGSFRTAALAALEEATLLPAQLRIERDALNTVAYYLTLPPTHILCPLLRDAIAAPPKNPKCCSILHLVERVPRIRWPPTVPACSQRIRTCRTPRLVGVLDDPLVDFDSSLGMEPILPVYAAPLREPLPVTTSILPRVDALRALSLALGDERRRTATWFTDDSLLDGRAGGQRTVMPTASRSDHFRAVPSLNAIVVAWTNPSISPSQT